MDMEEALQRLLGTSNCEHPILFLFRGEILTKYENLMMSVLWPYLSCVSSSDLELGAHGYYEEKDGETQILVRPTHLSRTWTGCIKCVDLIAKAYHDWADSGRIR